MVSEALVPTESSKAPDQKNDHSRFSRKSDSSDDPRETKPNKFLRSENFFYYYCTEGVLLITGDVGRVSKYAI